ncbi:hypothetical protein [Leptotrichia wadei]|nr:hypothetical protein [Leptotrichia wadei]
MLKNKRKERYMFNILKKFWNFLKEIFGGAEISNKNNTTQINKVKKNKDSIININQINNEKEKDND